MDTKPFFLPSEVARLVLGYLISQGFHQTSNRFLLECDYLAEFRKLKSMGLDYPTNIMGLSLVDILDNFGFMKTQALERYNLMASTDALWREFDSCLDKLKYKMFQSNSSKFNISKIRTNRKFPDRNVKVLPENIGEMLLKQGKILTSKQLAQNMKKLNENINTDKDLKSNPVQNSCTNDPNVNLEMQDLHQVSPVPAKSLPDNEEVSSKVTEELTAIPAESNRITQSGTPDKRKEQNRSPDKTNCPDEEMTTAESPTCHMTDSVPATSPSHQIPDCTELESAENPIPITTSENSIKQSDTGNPVAHDSMPNTQLLSLPVITSAVEVEVTPAVSQLDASVSLPLQASDSKCKPQLTDDECKPQLTTKPQLVYQSIETQSDFSPVNNPSLSTTSHNITTSAKTISSNSMGVQVTLPSRPNVEISPSANTLPYHTKVTAEEHSVASQEKNPSTDTETAAAVASLSFSPSPPHYKNFSSVYKTPLKNLQCQYRTPSKEYSQSESLNTPTREKNSLFSECVTPGKQSESDNSKSKRKRYPPEKRFFDITVPGPTQVRHESGSSQDSNHLKDQIPTFVEKVITETSLAEVLAETINRKLKGDTKSEMTTKNNENKSVEDGQKVDCDKLMDEIMLTDFHMTKSDIDEVIHQTSSAGIPVLDDLLKLFASVSEEKDPLCDEDGSEPAYESMIFEELDTCSQSAQNKDVKLVTSEDDLSKSDLKTPTKLNTPEDACEQSSLSKPSTTFLQVVDNLCSNETSTETSSNSASEDLSLKTFSTSQEEDHKSVKDPVPKIISDSESLVKNLQTSSVNINSSDDSKVHRPDSNAKRVSIPNPPSSCSRRSKVFSKGKSRKLVAAPILSSTNQNTVSTLSDSSLTSTISSPATTAAADKPISCPLVGDPHSAMATLTSESTTETTITTNSSHNCPAISVTPTKTSSTNLTCSSVESVPVSVLSELSVKCSTAAAASTSSFSNPTMTSTTIPSAPSLLQTDTNLALLAQPSSLPADKPKVEKIISASISESSSIVSRIIEPEKPAFLTNYSKRVAVLTSYPLPPVPLTNYLQPASTLTTYPPPTAPLTTYPPPTAPLTTYPPPAAPLTTYPPPAAPLTTYPQPAAPLTAYPQPAAPLTTYPVAPLANYSEQPVPQINYPEQTASITNYSEQAAPLTKSYPDQATPMTNCPVMFIITPTNETPQLQPTQMPVLDSVPPNLAYTNIQLPCTTNKMAMEMVPPNSVCSQPSSQKIAAPKNTQTKSRNPRENTRSKSRKPRENTRTKSINPRGRPKKDLSQPKPTQRKIYNIAPNKNLSALQLIDAGLQPSPQKRQTLALCSDNSWSIEMEPNSETVFLNLKNANMNEVLSYELTAEQVKDHLHSFIGTSEITDHILKSMEEIVASKSKNRPSILSRRKPRKKKPPVMKEACVTQPATGESNRSDHQGNNDRPVEATENEQQIDSCSQEDVMYVATSLGSVNDFLKKNKTETKESPKLNTSSPLSASRMMQMNDIKALTPNMAKSSPNLHQTLSKKMTSVEKSGQKPYECINDLPLDLTKENFQKISHNNSSDSSVDDKSNRTVHTLTKDNEYLAINILSTLCYAQRKNLTKTDSRPDDEKGEGNSSCESTAASPATCYKMLMEGKGPKGAPSVDLPGKKSPTLQEHYGDLHSALFAVSKSGQGTPQIKSTDSLIQGKQTLIQSKEKNSEQKKRRKGSNCKKTPGRSCIKDSKSKPVKRKLYERFEEEEEDPLSPKFEKKIYQTDIDLLLRKLHPDSSDGFDGSR